MVAGSMQFGPRVQPWVQIGCRTLGCPTVKSQSEKGFSALPLRNRPFPLFSMQTQNTPDEHWDLSCRSGFPRQSGAAVGCRLGCMANSPSPRLDPYVVLRGVGRLPWYRRRIPGPLRVTIGASTVTVRLAGHPHGNVAERRQYLAAYARVHGEAEQRLETAARGQRRLSASEQLGVAGHWVKGAAVRSADGTDAIEAAAVLRALLDLELVVNEPIRSGWQPDLSDAPAGAVTAAASALARQLQELEHPGQLPWPPGDLVWGDPVSARAGAWLSDTLTAAVPLSNALQQRAPGALAPIRLLLASSAALPVSASLPASAPALTPQQPTQYTR